MLLLLSSDDIFSSMDYLLAPLLLSTKWRQRQLVKSEKLTVHSSANYTCALIPCMHNTILTIEQLKIFYQLNKARANIVATYYSKK